MRNQRERVLMRQALALYASAPPIERAFVRVRALLSDLAAIERQAPPSGPLLELGCGHGLLTNLLALGDARREVLGIDIDSAKIEAARRTIGDRTNVRFAVRDATAIRDGAYAGIVVADVFYLLPPEEQRRLIATCYRLLRPGGLLVWKTQVRRPRAKFALTYGQEWVMTRLGPTQGQGLFFLDTVASQDAMRHAGFNVVTVPPRAWRPYTDLLFIGSKGYEAPRDPQAGTAR